MYLGTIVNSVKIMFGLYLFMGDDGNTKWVKKVSRLNVKFTEIEISYQ